MNRKKKIGESVESNRWTLGKSIAFNNPLQYGEMRLGLSLSFSNILRVSSSSDVSGIGVRCNTKVYTKNLKINKYIWRVNISYVYLWFSLLSFWILAIVGFTIDQWISCWTTDGYFLFNNVNISQKSRVNSFIFYVCHFS